MDTDGENTFEVETVPSPFAALEEEIRAKMAKLTKKQCLKKGNA